MVSWFDRVVDDREPLLVIRLCGKGNVIIPAEEEFAGWQETLRVLCLSSLTNAAPTVWPSFGNARPVVGKSTNRWRTTLPMPHELGLSPPGQHHSASDHSPAFMMGGSLVWPRNPVPHK
jgi:hypothetical protein